MSRDSCATGCRVLHGLALTISLSEPLFCFVFLTYFFIRSLTQVSDPSPKPSTSSMGEMTTADVSSRPPATEDAKSSQPAKSCLPDSSSTPGVDLTTSGPCQPLASLSQSALEPGNQNQGTSATSQAREGNSTLGEPMELEPGTWTGSSKPGHPQSNTDGVSHEQGTTRCAAEGTERRLESARTPELSLEELSISSRQQLMQVQASTAHRGTHTMTTARPNRKRKLLEDVESGKTLLLDAYRVWQQGQKVMTYDLGRIEKIMSETYMLIKQVSSKYIFIPLQTEQTSAGALHCAVTNITKATSQPYHEPESFRSILFI